MPLAGAPLDYQVRPGVTGPYGQFPSHLESGLDRYYGSAIREDCGKPNGFSTDGSLAQKGGAGLFRPLLNDAPPGAPYIGMMEHKGVPSYPTSDPVGYPPFAQGQGTYYVSGRSANQLVR